MAYASAEGGFGGAAPAVSVFPLETSHANYVSIPDAELLFTGDLRRAGPDLVLTGHDGRHHIVPGYFSSEKHAALVAPNGASLSADLVDLLAGSPAPAQYAQTQSTAPADPIGKVEKVVGNAIVIRNGVSVTLHVGDAVYKNDVIQTSTNSSVGIDFPDGTALNLVANTRMALNEYSYDANGNSNEALFSLVQGTFAFVAGKVAHTGDMKIETPVATMGIRGTTGYVQEQIGTITANVGNVSYSFAVADDYGTITNGAYELIDDNPTSPTYGQVIALVSQTGYLTFITPQGLNLPPLVTTQPMTNSQLGFEQLIIRQVFDILYSGPNPQSTPGTPGSGDNPSLIIPHLQLLEENGGQPLLINFQPNGGSNSGTSPLDFGTPPGGRPPPPPTPLPTSNVFIWNSGTGTWDTPPGWNIGSVPTGPSDTVEILSGTVIYNDNYTIGTLIVAPGATVDIVGGNLNVGTLEDGGKIEVSGDPPALTINGVTTVASGGSFVATGAGNEIIFVGNVFNSGVMIASDGGELAFDATVTNEPGSTGNAAGKIISAGTGSVVSFADDTLFNSGFILATHYGLVTLFDVALQNTGVIKAADDGTLIFDRTHVTNASCGVIEAFGHATLKLEHSFVANDGGLIAAFGCDARVELADSFVAGGSLATDGGGVIETIYGRSNLDGVTIAYDSDVLVNRGTTLTFAGGTTMLRGTLTIDKGGTLDVESSSGAVLDGVAVDNAGLIQVDSGTMVAILTLADDATVLGGTLSIGDHGIVDIEGSGATLDHVAVTSNGAIDVDYPFFPQTTTLTLEDGTTIDGGTLSIGNSGILDSIGTNVISDAEIANAGLIEVTSGALTIDPGSFSNTGVLEATDGGKLLIDDVVHNSGAGYALIEGGTLEFEAASNVGVVFNNGTGVGTGSNYGELILTDWKQFSGVITGFAGQETASPSLATTDEIDLVGFKDGMITHEAISGHGANETVTLTLKDSDGATVTLTFKDPGGTLDAKDVGNDTIIYDPPTTGSSSPLVSTSGISNDSFAFQPGLGANGVDRQNGSIESDHFAKVQETQHQWASLISADGHGDAFLDVGHHDCINASGVAASYLQAHLQSHVHLI